MYKQQIRLPEAGKSQGKYPKLTSWIVYFTPYKQVRLLQESKISHSVSLRSTSVAQSTVLSAMAPSDTSHTTPVQIIHTFSLYGVVLHKLGMYNNTLQKHT